MATTTAAGRLDAIAADMRRIITQTDARYAHRKLLRGLELVLQRNGCQYRLALGRTDGQPSDSEVEICIGAFGVPIGAEVQRTVKERPGKTGTRTYHVAELYWTETE